MMSWSDEPNGFGKSGSMTRGGSMSRGGAGTVGSPTSRRSTDLPVGSPANRRASMDVGSAASPKLSPLVKEGKRFDGWSHLVDNSTLNAPVDSSERPAAAVPAAVAAEPLKQQVGFAPGAPQPEAAAAPLPPAGSSGGGAPPAGAEADGKGWWTKMDQGVLNQKAIAADDAKQPSSFTPQFNITGQPRDLDWGESGSAKKEEAWDPFKN